jgi:hypothetical protein
MEIIIYLHRLEDKESKKNIKKQENNIILYAMEHILMY